MSLGLLREQNLENIDKINKFSVISDRNITIVKFYHVNYSILKGLNIEKPKATNLRERLVAFGIQEVIPCNTQFQYNYQTIARI